MGIFRWLLVMVIAGLMLGVGRPPAPANAYSAGTYAVAFSPDSQYAATGWEYASEESGNVRVWDVQSGALIKELDCETDHVFSLAFSPDRKYLACGGFMGVVLFDTTRWAKLRTMPLGMETLEGPGSISDVQSVAFTPDSQYVLSDSSNGARLWNVRTGELARWFWEPDVDDAAVLSPDGHTVLTFNEKQGVWLWNIATGQYLQKFTRGTTMWRALPPYVGPFSPDGKQVLIGGFSDGIHLWDIQARKDIRKLGQGALVGLFSPDGKYVLGKSIEHGTDRMQVWDAQTGQLVHEFSKPELDGEFSPDGNLLLTVEGATFTSEQIFRLYNVSNWKELRRLDGSFELTSVRAFSPDNRYLLIGYLTVGAQLWNVESGTLFHKLE